MILLARCKSYSYFFSGHVQNLGANFMMLLDRQLISSLGLYTVHSSAAAFMFLFTLSRYRLHIADYLVSHSNSFEV